MNSIAIPWPAAAQLVGAAGEQEQQHQQQQQRNKDEQYRFAMDDEELKHIDEYA